MKKTRIRTFAAGLLAALSLLLPLQALCDTIIMIDGKKYTGIVIGYTRGKFHIKSNGKKFTVYEADVKEIKWQATQAQLDAAYTGEPVEAKSKRNKLDDTFRMFAGLAGGYMMGMSSGSSAFSGFSTYGIEAGVDEGGSIWALDVFTGGASGTLSYENLVTGGQDQSKIDTSWIGILLSIKSRYSFISPVDVFWRLRAGGLRITDDIASYPADWNDWPYYAFTPVAREAVKRSYWGFCGALTGGLDITIAEKVVLTIEAGYMGHSRGNYYDPSQFPESDMEGSETIGSIFIGGGAVYAF